MGLERVHRTKTSERFGPIRLGPQDLRDIAAIFHELDSKVDLALPDKSRTTFHIEEHKTEDIEDVLAFADADTLPSLHIISAEILLSIHAVREGTMIEKPRAPTSAADRQAVENAAQKLRQITQARQVTRFEALRQRGPGKWLLAALLAVPALLLAGAQIVLDLWFTSATSQAVAAGLVWASVVPLLLISAARSKDLIRLRGQQKPWWERRQGLITLVGVVLTPVIAFVIYGLESRQK